MRVSCVGPRRVVRRVVRAPLGDGEHALRGAGRVEGIHTGGRPAHYEVQDFVARDLQGVHMALQRTRGWRTAAAVMQFFLGFTIFAAILYPYFVGDVPSTEYGRIVAAGPGAYNPRGIVGKNDVAWLWNNFLGFTA